MKLLLPFAVTDAALVSLNVLEADASAYNALASYALGGQAIYAHRLYESLQAANVGHAVTDAAWWLDLGPTNAWSMFDQSNGTITSQATDIAVTVQTTGRINGVAALTVTGTSVRVLAEVATSTPGVYDTVYDETASLVSSAGIDNWYSYFFDDVVMLGDFVAVDLPPYNDLRITVEVTADATAAIGNLVFGKARDLGGTVYGAKVGIIDYSRKTADEFGGYTIVERTFSRRGNFTIFMENNQVDAVAATLTQYRATPVVWIGADDFASTFIFGFFRDWATEIAYVNHSTCTLEIEGLS